MQDLILKILSFGWVLYMNFLLGKILFFYDTGKLIGFVDLGSTQNRIDEPVKTLSSEVSSTVSEEATHMFVFTAVSPFSNLNLWNFSNPPLMYRLVFLSVLKN